MSVLCALGIFGTSLCAADSAAQVTSTVYESCLLEKIESASDDAAVSQLRRECLEETRQEEPSGPGMTQHEYSISTEDSLLYQRLEREIGVESLPSILTPHNRNYILPLSYVREPNGEPYQSTPGDNAFARELDNLEVKFQLSIKFRLAGGFFHKNDRLYFGFTALSFWQAYNKLVSAPFRETNYEPEIFWVSSLPWRPFGIDGSLLGVGYSHESNGGTGQLSRSWNRLYANLSFEKGRYVFSVKPWWRIPEREKRSPFDASGDDNPDIEHYMGHFEFAAAQRIGEHEVSLMLRNNMDTDKKGAVRLEWAYPLWGNVRGFAQYYNGYGESLIDYNVRIERIGVGILISSLF